MFAKIAPPLSVYAASQMSAKIYRDALFDGAEHEKNDLVGLKGVIVAESFTIPRLLLTETVY